MAWTIRKKLICICTILLALPTLAIGGVSYFTAKNSLGELGAKGLKNNVVLAKQLISVLNDEVKQGKITLKEAQEKAKTELIGEKQQDGKRLRQSQVDMGKYGYFFVLDDKGTALAHPEKEGENLSDSKTPDGLYSTREIIKKAHEGGGYLTFQFQVPGEDELAPKITYAEQEPNWGWIVTSGSYLSDFNSAAGDLLKMTAAVLAAALAIGLVLIFWFAGKLSKPIVQITKEVEKLANGDLRTEPVVIRTKDEVGELSAYFNQMAANLREMILHVSEASHQVAGTSEQLSASSEETAKLVQQVAESIHDVATGADVQVAKAAEANQAAASVASHTAHIGTYVDEVNLASRQTADGAVNGNEIIKKTVNHMKTVQEKTLALSGIVNGLGYKSKEIGKIVSMITSVAEQTNLLALNASIEAARAGEQGKGFAVVANEVRKLAEQSADAASQISRLIADIQVDISQSVSAMNEGKISVDEGLHLVDQAGDAFKDIVQAVQHVSEQIGEVSSAVQDMSAETKEMAELIVESADISNESAGHTEEIAASAQQQSASVEEITTVSNTLADMAEDLQSAISDFKI